jgi:hypothetical protein
MVLEAIVVPQSWEQHPKRMLIIGFVYATIGLFLGIWVFGRYSSLAAIFLTTIPLVVIMYRAINDEEEKGLKICKEYLLIKEHMIMLSFFLYLFIGMVAAYTFWFIFMDTLMPQKTVDMVFSTQLETINAIGARVSYSGSAVGPPGIGLSFSGAAISKWDRLGLILRNNLQVWAFCLLFSLLYGAGAIFILAWNASVIGVAIGNVIKEGLRTLVEFGHNPTLLHYFTVIPMGLSYLVHGLPEVASFFLASLAGGIVSVAVVCHHWRSPDFLHVITDSLDLVGLSFILLVASAFIEVYVTPILF